jgi:voltage-gated potassium channel
MKVNGHIVFALALGILFLMGGTFYYTAEEGWSHTDSFYFSTITLTTIGYGDLHPTTDESKIFTALYTLAGVGVMLYLLGTVIATFLFNQEKYFEKMIYHFRKQQDEEKIPKGKKKK